MTKVHLSLSQWPLVRRLGATGRPVRLVLQLVAGAACLLGSFVWATERLSDLAGPAPMTVAVARLDDWPEIKNGVPDLKRVDPVRPSSFEPLPLAHARSSEAPAKPADTAVPMGELPTSGQHISRLEPSSPSTAPVVQGAVPTREAEKPANGVDARVSVQDGAGWRRDAGSARGGGRSSPRRPASPREHPGQPVRLAARSG